MDCKIVLLFLAFLYVAQAQLDFGVTCHDKKVIVNLHNKLRRKVAKGKLPGQPKAANMLSLSWDEKLANMAQNWANNMQFEHNKNRHDGRFKVGENIYTSWSTGPERKPNWREAIKDWFSENKLYTFQPLISDPSTGHYTQMIWAKTEYVGCGFTLYKKNGVLNKLYVCNYGPAGNMLGQDPYEIGSGCEHLCCKSECNNFYGDNCE